MPRRAGPNSCLNCRRRKIRCDENVPQCLRCQRARLSCDRSSGIIVKQFKVPGQSITHDPQELLRHSHIATLFQTYLKELAPWYDLNDESRSFAREGASRALSSPLFFAAAIALASLYSARKASSSLELADLYHGRCLSYLIDLGQEDTAVRDGTALAATCLLRSYEILAEESDPNRHLFGASTLLPTQSVAVRERSLLTAGFWNFLREDITYSLIHGCPLKIKVERPHLPSTNDRELSNAFTLLLGQAVNLYFSPVRDPSLLSELQDDLDVWQQTFKVRPFASFQKDNHSFPSLMMLEDTHVAAMHYLLVAQCMFPDHPSDREQLAAKICGLAMSSRSDAVTVNAYGPICFSARWLPQQRQQDELVTWLQATKRSTGWAVDAIVKQLKHTWAEGATE